VLAKLAVLPNPPTEVREDTSAMAHLAAPPRNEKIVYLRSQSLAEVMSPKQMRLELLAGAGVATCSRPNTFNTTESTVLHLTAGYFNGGLAALPSESLMWGNDRIRGEIEEAWQTLRAQSAQEQLHRVAQARRMLLACEDSERTLDVLTAPR
jgi:hypothetical protein